VAAADIAIGKTVAVSSSAFRRKAELRHARLLYRRELNNLIDEINQAKSLADVDGVTLLRAIIFLGAAYLAKRGKSEMATEALKGIMPLMDHLRTP
jgi:hypothetical protein